MSTKTRRSYTAVFKEEAVRLVRESGHPVTQVARDLGIADHLLYRWRTEQQQAERHGQTRQSVSVERAELAQLRRSSRWSPDEIPGNPGARPSPDLRQSEYLAGVPQTGPSGGRASRGAADAP